MKQIRQLSKHTITTIALCFVIILGIIGGAQQVQAASKKTSFKVKKYHHTYKDNNGDTIKEVSYEYPYFTGKSKAARRLNKFFSKKKKSWIKYSKENLEDAAFLHEQLIESGTEDAGYYSDSVKCKLTVYKNKYINILQEGSNYQMGAHGTPYAYSYIFDITTGKQVKPAKLLGCSQKSLNKKVSKLYLKKYDKTYNTDKFCFFVDRNGLKKELSSTNFNKIKFGQNGCYIKKNRVYFYYDPCIIAPYAAGYVTISIPLPKSK